MATKLFVNLPVCDLDDAKRYFTGLGFEFFGMADDMASIIISEHTQVMLLAQPTFAGYAQHPVADQATEAILVLGVADRAAVDTLVDRAVATGGKPIGQVRDGGGVYQRGFADLDGHQWSVLTLTNTTG
jgi:predicted lactoylglutathione lyase